MTPLIRPMPLMVMLSAERPRGSMRPHQGQGVGLLAALDVTPELLLELADRLLDRPAGAVGQTADRRPRHDADAVAHLFEDLQILLPALAATDAIHDLEHP